MSLRKTAKVAKDATVGAAIGAAGGWIATALGLTFLGGAGFLAFGPVVGALLWCGPRRSSFKRRL